MENNITKQIFEAVTGDQADDTNLSQKAEEAEPGNFLRHVASLSASKIKVVPVATLAEAIEAVID